jgi:hypothetical protein
MLGRVNVFLTHIVTKVEKKDKVRKFIRKIDKKKLRKRMSNNNKRWNKLFLFCLGLFVASAFCMKWMESGFIHNGALFTIIGLEISYPKDQVIAILSGLSPVSRTLLQNHLVYDFVFMAGVYPGIACLCMIARNRHRQQFWKRLLFSTALLQLLAWACDIGENYFLLKWIKAPVIGNDFQLYHSLVYIKWFLALSGILIAGIMLLFRRRNREKV